MFVTSTDFIGFYQIAKPNSHKIGELQSYIDNVEPNVLRDLLGCDLYTLFIADLVGGIPQTQRFIDIFNSFCFDDGVNSGCQHRSSGMVTMLKGFVYYNYVRDADYFNTISGNVKNDFTNSSSINSMMYGLDERHNVALSTYEQIQWFIFDNSTDYPEYNGLNKSIQTWL